MSNSNNKEKGCKWHFFKNVDGYSFGAGVAPQKNFKKASVAASIVRESLQNSIDAAESFPVRVVYAKDNLTINDYPGLFGVDICEDGNYLQDHFTGIVNSFNINDEQNIKEYKQKAKYVEDIKQNTLFPRKIPYLRISDYNTTGMDYLERNKGHFASFVRSAGRNDKNSKGSAGSCGVGKGAYIQMSQFNALLVSSRTEKQAVFEGFILAVSHSVNNNDFHPYAFYDNNSGKPVVDSDDIPDKFIRKEIGTDINIIGIDDNSWKNQVEEMIKAVLRNFWFAIYKERLVVEIENVLIDQKSLPDLLLKYFPDSKDGAQTRTYNPRVYYNIVISEPSDKIIHRKDNLPLLGKVEFYLNKSKTGNGRILYMRKDRMLIYSKIEPMYNQINAIFVCTDEKGNTILKDAENEAHNEWRARTGDETTKNAIKELEEYIQKCLEEEIGSVTKQTVDIKSLAKRLPISTEPVFDDEYDEELDLETNGDTITETLETTDAGIISHRGDKTEPAGKVLVKKKKPVSPMVGGDEFEESQDGIDNPDVNSTYKPTELPGIIPDSPNIIPGLYPNETFKSKSETNKENLEGQQKKTVSINSFESRTFVRSINGEYVYDVRIRCNKEYKNVTIVVTIEGETSDDFIDIKESSVGTIDGHKIQGIHLINGLNSFTMKFNENEKVRVKISAYEYTD